MRYISQTLDTLKELLKKKGIESDIGDMAIFYETSSTWEFGQLGRQDSKVLTFPTGKNGLPGKDGDTPKVDYEKISDDIFDRLSNDKKFYDRLHGMFKVPTLQESVERVTENILTHHLEDIKGKDGEDAKTPKIDYDKIKNALKNDQEFIEKTKGTDGIGQDGVSPTTEEVVLSLIHNGYFLEKVSGKDGEDGVSPKIEDIVNILKNDQEFIEKTKGQNSDIRIEHIIDALSISRNGIQQIFTVKGLYEEIGKDGDWCIELEKKEVFQKINGTRVFRY